MKYAALGLLCVALLGVGCGGSTSAQRIAKCEKLYGEDTPGEMESSRKLNKSCTQLDAEERLTNDGGIGSRS